MFHYAKFLMIAEILQLFDFQDGSHLPFWILENYRKMQAVQ